MKKIYCVIVLYNNTIDNSITCSLFSKLSKKNIKVLILDNSTKDFGNKKIADKKGFMYLSMEGNKGLSKAYNVAINYLFNIEKASYSDYVVWLDDDTHINEEYFVCLENNIKTNEDADIFAPIIYGQDGVIYSPNNARFIKNNLIKNREEAFSLVKYNAINSCLCVKLDVYKDYRYDEILFLDQIDQNFFDDMRKLNKKFITINTIIYQNFSQRGKKLDAKKMLIRYKIRVKDIMRYGRKSFKNTIMSFIKAFGLSIQMGIKCKSLKIIFCCACITIGMLFHNLKILIFVGKY